MNFESVFEYLLSQFKKDKIDYALIGGFALHAAGHTRATQDIDLLILVDDIPKAKQALVAFGYEVAHESRDVINFHGKLRELGQIDIVQAHRQYARGMLQRAKKYDILNNKFSVKIVMPEDLIGLKVQSSSNDPKRLNRDRADIEVILQKNHGRLDLNLVREYFTLFDREAELDEMLKRLSHVD